MDTLKELSDYRLLILLQEGNRLAFNQIYFRYWEKMYRSAFNVIQDQDEAKDIVQDIFFCLWRKRKTQKIENLSPYLFQAVKFQVAKHLKKGRITKQHEAQIALLNTHNSTEDEINYQELSRRLHTTLDQLPIKRREVFCLSRFEQLSNKEIAKKLNLSPRTVEWHISNALRQIRRGISVFMLILLNILISS
ncbi:RNA polymerase sigma-70 factor [Fulvivirgaceae bacterium BMA12]|uniref:RNA polymerase sigma-70 factor n=1 Tax=Agaribacillus aureus TaxID=3051825 RepID=A0ABT8KZU4_9BACT|nr:RNA polymerase sigma-70 factor [Fulvivirgaceae bacterium BMA12]